MKNSFIYHINFIKIELTKNRVKLPKIFLGRYMLRFAPSPTRDMHIGDLRVALFNYIIAQQKNEDFIVRVEDMDKEENIEGKDKEILDLLALFNIKYSQIIYQSENIRFHTAMALQLMHEKKAFSCFCSDNWLDGKKQEAKDAKQVYKYDDACRNLPDELVLDNTNPFTIRIKKADEAEDMDSFIILNQDKTPTQNFASAVDDMLSDISIVIQDEKYKKDTPKQEHIRASLAYEKKIKYIYLPSIIDDDKISIKWLLEEGFLPEAISNYLVSTAIKPPRKIFNMINTIEWFDIFSILKEPVKFNMDILRHINNEHLKNLEDKELSRYVGFADEEIGKLAKVYLKELSTTKELKLKISAIFNKKELNDEFLEVAKIIKNTPYFEKYEDFKKYILDNSDLADEHFSKSFYYLLTDSENGPEIAEIYKYLKNYIGEIIK